MKFLLLLVIAFPFVLHAQSKKDTKILITVSDTTKLFDKVALAFYQNGYTVEHKDQALGFMATGEKALKSYSVKFKALIQDSVITLTGEMADNVQMSIGGARTERAFYGLHFGGMKGSPLRLGWNEMDRLAKLFGSNVTYSK